MSGPRELDLEEVRKKFTYDPETGVLTSKYNGKPAGCICKKGYVKVTIAGRQIKAHRICWLLHYGYSPQCPMDHINRIRHDNRIENLRLASASINRMNQSARRGNRKDLPIGVSFDRNKWAAQCYIGKKNHHLGRFDTPEEAGQAYKDFVDIHKKDKDHSPLTGTGPTR